MSAFAEMLVVEGRDDTKRLLETFGQVDTIETNGSAIDDKTLALIARAQATRGVIVLTDPDFPGEKIRKTITAAVPGVKHAFLPVKDAHAAKPGASLGVEHASPEALRTALAQVMTPGDNPVAQIDRADLVAAGLVGGPNARKRREQLGEVLHIGYTNAKQLHKRLTQFQITPAAFEAAVAAIDQTEDPHA